MPIIRNSLFVCLLTLIANHAGSHWFPQPSSTDEVYLGISFSRHRGVLVGENGIILTTADSGKTWRQMRSGTNSLLLGAHMVDDRVAVVFGLGGTILVSKDSGSTWQKAKTETELQINAVSFADTVNGIAVGSLGLILRTTDSGTTWAHIFGPTRDELVGVQLVDSLSGIIIGSSSTLLRTTDGGFHWSRPSRYGFEHDSSFNVKGFSSMSFIDRKNGLICGESSLLRTSDGGSSWTVYQPSITGYSWWRDQVPSIFSLRFLDSNNVIGNELGKIVRSTNGGLDWSVSGSIPSPCRLHAVSFITSNIGIAIGECGVIMRTTNSGNYWLLLRERSSIIKPLNLGLVEKTFIKEKCICCAGMGKVANPDYGKSFLTDSSYYLSYRTPLVLDRTKPPIGYSLRTSPINGRNYWEPQYPLTSGSGVAIERTVRIEKRDTRDSLKCSCCGGWGIVVSRYADVAKPTTTERTATKKATTVEPFAALRSDHAQIRADAAESLGVARVAAAVIPLIEALKDEWPYVRQVAAIALGNIGDSRAIQPLREALKDKYPNVRNAAATALAKITK